MTKHTNLQILDHIIEVHRVSKSCKFNDKKMAALKKHLTPLEAYFDVNEMQAFFLALIMGINTNGYSVNLENLSDYIDCSSLTLLKYNEDFRVLFEKGFLNIRLKSDLELKSVVSWSSIELKSEICDAILSNEAIPKLKKQVFDCPLEMIDAYGKLVTEEKDNETPKSMFYKLLKSFITSNNKNPLLQEIEKIRLNEYETYLFLYVIWRNLIGEYSESLTTLIDLFYGDRRPKISVTQSYINKRCKLVKLDYIELKHQSFINSTDIEISNKSIKMLKKLGIVALNEKEEKSDKSFILPKNIRLQHLFYNEKEAAQINTLQRLLQEKQFRAMQTRLSSKNLSQGVTAILHGPPGTGKTELAMQLAKNTNRNILKIDISQTKSMWFGESEKRIKKIFDKYKNLKENSKITPILFLNEADGVLSKRNGSVQSSLDQTMNAMQNILLEELENFSGILLATTNLTGNLDKAFERRFLFKINIEQPSIDIKSKIWIAKIPELDKKEALYLASNFDFSGGEINNVVRKKEIEEILQGEKLSFQKLIAFCEEEKFESKAVKAIGFK